jgi:hypothetical protein
VPENQKQSKSSLWSLTGLAAWEERNNFPKYASSLPFALDARKVPSNWGIALSAGVGEGACGLIRKPESKTHTPHVQCAVFDFINPSVLVICNRFHFRYRL